LIWYPFYYGAVRERCAPEREFRIINRTHNVVLPRLYIY